MSATSPFARRMWKEHRRRQRDYESGEWVAAPARSFGDEREPPGLVRRSASTPNLSNGDLSRWHEQLRQRQAALDMGESEYAMHLARAAKMQGRTSPTKYSTVPRPSTAVRSYPQLPA